jgi:hypothetical protein
MELKDYQRRVLEKFDGYVCVLKAEQEKSAKAVATLKAAKVDIPQGLDDYPGNAWKALTSKGFCRVFATHSTGWSFLLMFSGTTVRGVRFPIFV